MNVLTKPKQILQNRIDSANRARLHNVSPSIIASNCIGGFISHYLNLKFLTPTINLFIEPEDYIKMLQSFSLYFLEGEIEDVTQADDRYPMGKINGAAIHFMHYRTFQEAADTWYQRRERINLDSLYIMMTDRDGCTYEHIKAFDSLPFQNKVIFTHVPYPEIKSSFYIRGFEKEPQVGHLHSTMNLMGYRYIDQFDYVAFLNGEGLKRR